MTGYESAPIRPAPVYGSARANRFRETAMRWTLAELQACGGFALDLIDPAAPYAAPA